MKIFKTIFLIVLIIRSTTQMILKILLSFSNGN